MSKVMQALLDSADVNQYTVGKGWTVIGLQRNDSQSAYHVGFKPNSFALLDWPKLVLLLWLQNPLYFELEFLASSFRMGSYGS